MRILLPTGEATADIVRKAAEGYGADVVVTGPIASFLTPRQLRSLIGARAPDLVLVSGMCTASFAAVEEETGVPIFLGPRHAADLGLVLPRIAEIPLSRTVPADEALGIVRREAARAAVRARESAAQPDLWIRGVGIGGGSRMKVLAEIMDAPGAADIRSRVEGCFAAGADIVDLGFGFDATPADVVAVFSALSGIEGPLAADTQDPSLIRAALPRADLVLSLHEGNIGETGREIAEAGAAAVVVPGEAGLAKNLALAAGAGISALIADPLLVPVGSGFLRSACARVPRGYPRFFGAGNVTELIDADSPGVNALLAGMAWEAGAAVIFTSEHSDKTRGSIREMRRATEMMALLPGRLYPKDLGIDLFCIKEKRRRREPPLRYDAVVEAVDPPPREITCDPCGNFRIGIEGDSIVAVVHGKAYRGCSWDRLFTAILGAGDVSRLDHAAYLGKELYKAELSLRFGRSFEQDGPF